MLFNVSYIIYTWLSYSISSNNDRDTDIRLYQSMINWLEFFGLIYMFFMFCIYGIYKKKYNFACDYYQMMGQWSVFKLFYRFRYSYILQYSIDVFTNNSINFESQYKNIDLNSNTRHSFAVRKILAVLNKINQKTETPQQSLRWYRSRISSTKILCIMCFMFLLIMLIIGLIFGILSLVLKLQQLTSLPGSGKV